MIMRNVVMTLLCLAFALTAAPVHSDPAQVIARPDQGDSIVIPPKSTLRFRAFDKEGTAKFDGKLLLSGTYYYGSNAIDDGEGFEPALYFIPDKATKARLPIFKERGMPGEIYLSNPRAFVTAVIPKESLATFGKSRARYLSGKADIWVDQFEAGIECDAPFFDARFMSVAHAPLKVALADPPDTGC